MIRQPMGFGWQAIFCGCGGTRRRGGPRSRRAKSPLGVQLPSSAPIQFDRGVVGMQTRRAQTPLGGNARAGATPAAATIFNAAVRGTVDRAVLKTAASLATRGRASRPGRTSIFRRVVECIHASLRNSWAKARAGANPVSPTN